MICPFCQHENVTGADTCEACQQSLTDVATRSGGKTGLEESIETSSLRVLEPARPITASPTDRVREAIRLLAERNIGAVLVVWSDTLIGIFSERDVLMKIGTRLDEVADEPIRHFMTPLPETLTRDDTIAFALNRMAVGEFRHIPIESEEKPVGIISVRDVLAYLTMHFPEIGATFN